MTAFIEVHTGQPEPTYLNVDYIRSYVVSSSRDGQTPATAISLSSSAVSTNAHEVMYVEETVQQISALINLTGVNVASLDRYEIHTARP